MLKLQQIGEITTQEARRHQVNKVKHVLLKIHSSVYLLESIPIQILYNDGHFENYATARTIELGLPVDRKATHFLYLFFLKEVIRWLIKNRDN